MGNDEKDLRILSIFYYIAGGFSAFFAVGRLMMFFIGIIRHAVGSESVLGPPFIRHTIASMIFHGLFFPALGGAVAACLIIAGWQIARRKHYVFCLVIGAISLLIWPFGIISGVFTIVILMRPSVRELFEANKGVTPI